jgi:hypothetical protein
MEAYDDVVTFGQTNQDNDFTASSSRDASWQEYEDSVLADEKGKAKMLTAIKSAARSRGTSLQNISEFRELERNTMGDFGIPDKTGKAVDRERDIDEDVRKHLFETMPAPYPHSDDYQKVTITELGDVADRDTINACKSIKRCMELRQKYLAAHNFSSATKPPLQRSVTDDCSRRAQPEYDVFNRPLPPATNEYQIGWRNGVFTVQQAQLGEAAPSFSVLPFQQFFSDFNYVNFSFILSLSLFTSSLGS